MERKFVQLLLRRAACVAELLERIDGPRLNTCVWKGRGGQEKQFNHGSATLRADDRLFWAPADIIISMSRSYERGN